MYGLDTIKALNAEAAAKARSRRTRPTRISSVDQVDAWPPYPFKYLGNACDDWDEVYTRQESLFCDSSGWGAPGEPALTADQLRERLHELVQEHGVIYVAIEEMGQFQLHLAVWAE